MQTDPFRTAPLRVLGYGYAVGVALRYRFCQDLKDACYVVATTFIVCHTLYRGKTEEDPIYMPVIDTLIFELLASVAIPTLTTHYICSTTKKYLKTISGLPKPAYKWVPLIMGLAVLPFLYKSLDTCVVKFMNETVRPLYMC